MTPLELMENWLRQFPQWDCGKVYIDSTDGIPGNAGLFPKGLTEVSRKQDVTGRTTSVCRITFDLIFVRAEEQEKNALWLLELQQWIQQESGNAPQFGDDAQSQRIWAQQGNLRKAKQTGTVHYGVTLTVEFIKYD